MHRPLRSRITLLAAIGIALCMAAGLFGTLRLVAQEGTPSSEPGHRASRDPQRVIIVLVDNSRSVAIDNEVKQQKTDPESMQYRTKRVEEFVRFLIGFLQDTEPDTKVAVAFWGDKAKDGGVNEVPLERTGELQGVSLDAVQRVLCERDAGSTDPCTGASINKGLLDFAEKSLRNNCSKEKEHAADCTLLLFSDGEYDGKSGAPTKIDVEMPLRKLKDEFDVNIVPVLLGERVGVYTDTWNVWNAQRITEQPVYIDSFVKYQDDALLVNLYEQILQRVSPMAKELEWRSVNGLATISKEVELSPDMAGITLTLFLGEQAVVQPPFPSPQTSNNSSYYWDRAALEERQVSISIRGQGLIAHRFEPDKRPIVLAATTIPTTLYEGEPFTVSVKLLGVSGLIDNDWIRNVSVSDVESTKSLNSSELESLYDTLRPSGRGREWQREFPNGLPVANTYTLTISAQPRSGWQPILEPTQIVFDVLQPVWTYELSIASSEVYAEQSLDIGVLTFQNGNTESVPGVSSIFVIFESAAVRKMVTSTLSLSDGTGHVRLSPDQLPELGTYSVTMELVNDVGVVVRGAGIQIAVAAAVNTPTPTSADTAMPILSSTSPPPTAKPTPIPAATALPSPSASPSPMPTYTPLPVTIPATSNTVEALPISLALSSGEIVTLVASGAYTTVVISPTAALDLSTKLISSSELLVTTTLLLSSTELLSIPVALIDTVWLSPTSSRVETLYFEPNDEVTATVKLVLQVLQASEPVDYSILEWLGIFTIILMSLVLGYWIFDWTNNGPRRPIELTKEQTKKWLSTYEFMDNDSKRRFEVYESHLNKANNFDEFYKVAGIDVIRREASQGQAKAVWALIHLLSRWEKLKKDELLLGNLVYEKGVFNILLNNQDVVANALKEIDNTNKVKKYIKEYSSWLKSLARIEKKALGERVWVLGDRNALAELVKMLNSFGPIPNEEGVLNSTHRRIKTLKELLDAVRLGGALPNVQDGWEEGSSLPEPLGAVAKVLKIIKGKSAAEVIMSARFSGDNGWLEDLKKHLLSEDFETSMEGRLLRLILLKVWLIGD